MQLLESPNVLVETPSYAARSGLILPSIVGPCELYGRMDVPPSQHTAPTPSTYGDSAGSATLPCGTLRSSVPVVMKRSKRLVAAGGMALIVA